jgi:hypothetical protein
MRCPRCGAMHGPTEWWPVVAPDAPPHILASVRDGSIHHWTCDVCRASLVYRSPFVYYDPTGPVVLFVLEFHRDRPEALHARRELPRRLRDRLTPPARRATYGRMFDVANVEQLTELLALPPEVLQSLRPSPGSRWRLELPAADRYALIVDEALKGASISFDAIELDQGLLEYIDDRLKSMHEGEREQSTLIALRSLVDQTIDAWNNAAPSGRIASCVRAITRALKVAIEPAAEWLILERPAVEILQPDATTPQHPRERCELPLLSGLGLDELAPVALDAEAKSDALALTALGRRCATARPSRRRRAFYAGCLLRSLQLQDFTTDALAWWSEYSWALGSPQVRRRMTEPERSFHCRVLRCCAVGLARVGQVGASQAASELATWLDPEPIANLDEGRWDWSELAKLRRELEEAAPKPVPSLEMTDGPVWPETTPVKAGKPYDLSISEAVHNLPHEPMVLRRFRTSGSSLRLAAEALVRDPIVDSLVEAAQQSERQYADDEASMLMARRMALVGAVHQAALVAISVVERQQTKRHPSTAVIADAASVFNVAAQASLEIGYRNSSILMATCAGELADLGIALAEHHSTHAIGNEMIHLLGERAWSLELAGAHDAAVSAYSALASHVRTSRSMLLDRYSVRRFQQNYQRVAARLARVLDDGSGEFQGAGLEHLSEMLAIADEGRNRAIAGGRSLLDLETWVWEALPENVLVLNYLLAPATSGHPGGWYVFALQRGASPVCARLDMPSVWEAVADVAQFGSKITATNAADLSAQWARHEAHWRKITTHLGDVLCPGTITSVIHECVAKGFRLVLCPDEYLFGVPIGAASISLPGPTRVELWSIHPDFGAPVTASNLVSIIHRAAERPRSVEGLVRSSDRANRIKDGADVTTLDGLMSGPSRTAWIHIGHSAMSDAQPGLRFADGLLLPSTIAGATQGSLLRSLRFAALLACRSSDVSGQDEWERHELEGLFAELLVNGCEYVLGSSWPLAVPVAQAVAETLTASLGAGADPLSVWASACRAARTTTQVRFGNIPFLWTGLALMI